MVGLQDLKDTKYLSVRRRGGTCVPNLNTEFKDDCGEKNVYIASMSKLSNSIGHSTRGRKTQQFNFKLSFSNAYPKMMPQICQVLVLKHFKLEALSPQIKKYCILMAPSNWQCTSVQLIYNSE